MSQSSKTVPRGNPKIVAALATIRQWRRSQRRRMARLQPVEGLRIPVDSRRTLTRFWHAHPALRRACLDKYGFDPIEDEEAYWRYGLAEADHQDVLRAVQRNGNRFSFSLVKRWEVEELGDGKSPIGET